MKVIASSISVICVVIIMTTVLSITAFASAGFTTTPQLPENQRDGVTNYFDVFLQPGQSQELSLIVENVTDAEIVLTAEVLAVATSESGDIIYMPSETFEHLFGEGVEHTPEFMMPDFLRLNEEQVVIPANSYRAITFTLTMPPETFQGTILGAITVVRNATDAELAEAGNFLFEFASTVAVRMQQVIEPAEPGFELHSVQADLVMHRATFVANIVNTEKRVIHNASVNVRIYPENSGDPIIEYTNDSISIAPNSLLPLSIRESESEGIQSGDYIARVNLLYGGMEWNFEEIFTITVEAAAQINRAALNVVTDNENTIPLWVMPTIASGVVLIIGIIIAFVLKERANKKKYENLMRKMQELERRGEQPAQQQPAQQQPAQPQSAQRVRLRSTQQPQTHDTQQKASGKRELNELMVLLQEKRKS